MFVNLETRAPVLQKLMLRRISLPDIYPMYAHVYQYISILNILNTE